MSDVENLAKLVQRLEAAVQKLEGGSYSKRGQNKTTPK